jgi:hypothetical protein
MRLPSTSGVSMVAAVAQIMSSISGPAAVIVVPIAAAFVMANWVYNVYQRTWVHQFSSGRTNLLICALSNDIVRCLIGYIVDLTMVMQSLFWLMDVSGHDCNLSRRHIKIAFTFYLASAERTRIHADIQKYVRETNVWDRLHEDRALAKVTMLILGFDPTAAFKELVQAQAVVIEQDDQDEPWN